MTTVHTHPWRDLDEAEMTACMRLNLAVWPKPEPLAAVVAERLRQAAEPESERCANHLVHRVLAADGGLQAMARSFRRVIAVDGQRLTVLALAGVCVEPSQRGTGLGAAVVQAAFDRIDDALPVSLFQTGVPGFYRRLGSREIDNRITDSTGAERLFWEPHAMIHPATADWPAGPVDLLGSGW